MQVRLIKLSENPNALRTKETDGYASRMPTVGERFTMFGEGYSDPSLVRMIDTSPVVEIEDGSPVKHGEVFHYFFKTESGTRYQLVVS